MRGGTAERSRERGVSVPLLLGIDGGDEGGEMFEFNIFVFRER